MSSSRCWGSLREVLQAALYVQLAPQPIVGPENHRGLFRPASGVHNGVMKRTSWVVALALACTGCGQQPGPRRATSVVTVTRAGVAPRVSAAPATARIPPRWRGRYWVADGSVLTSFEVGPAGVEKSLKLHASEEQITGLAVSPDGRHLVFSEWRESEARTGALLVMPAAGGKPRVLTSCDFACRLGGVGADGEVWFVNVESTSKLGAVSHVPLAGGPTVAWPHSFADCYVDATISVNGKVLLIGADNSLGWPACIDGGHQGLYVVSLVDSEERDTPPARIGCFGDKPPSEINISIENMGFDGEDRIVVSVVDAWSQPAPIPGMPLPSWSCQRDGQDVHRADDQLVLRAGLIDGRGWVVATRADTNPDPGDPPSEHTKPLPIAGPVKHVSAFVHRPRTP